MVSWHQPPTPLLQLSSFPLHSMDDLLGEVAGLQQHAREEQQHALAQSASCWLRDLLGQDLPAGLTLEELLANGWIL